MDSIKLQKQQAMRNYKMKAQMFCIKIAVYSLAAFISSLFYLCIFWFPTMKHFISIYLPSIYSLFFSSKFIFILANFIVVILIGDSKLLSDNSDEIYNEYISKSQGLNHMNKQHPPSLMSSDDDVSKNMAQDQVLRPLRTVTSCNRTLHDATYPNKCMATDPVLHPLKTVTSRSNLVLSGVTDPKKSSMGTKTQGRPQRKKPKRQVHEKIATTTLHDRKDDSIIICSAEVVGFVEKVNGMELRESTEESSKGNIKEEEKINIHHDSEGGKGNGKEIEKIEAEEEEINVYHDHDSLQRDELNRKVEEFIARVNRRRMLEAGQGAY